MKKSHCEGCRNDFYNGKNPYGIAECWSFKDAKIVWMKAVPYDLLPPWTMKAERVPDCYHRDGVAYINPKRSC